MVRRSHRRIMLDGAHAALSARIARQALPACPYPPSSKRRLYWHWGAERAGGFVDQLAGGVL